MFADYKLNTQRIIVLYCMILWATNWGVTTTHELDETIVRTSSYDLRFWHVLLSGFITFSFTHHLWRRNRELLDRRIRVPADYRIWDNWGTLLLLLPLLVTVKDMTTSVEEDGTLVTTVYEYGNASELAVLLTGAAIMIFQAFRNIESLSPEFKRKATLKEKVRPEKQSIWLTRI